MRKISAILVTRNEERKIGRCLESLRWVDEIVVVDQSSTDATAEVCRKYTPHVFITENKGYCEPDRPVALAHTSHDWVLYLDADEVVPAGLREEIQAILASEPPYACYSVARRNIFMGKWIRGSGWYPGYVLRLFRKDYAGFSERIHTDVIPSSPCGRLKNPLEHYTCENIEEYLLKFNRYSTILAKQEYARGARLTARNGVFRLVCVPAAVSLRKYFFHLGFCDGFQGFVIAFLTFLTLVLMNIKLWEMQYGIRAGSE